MSSKDSSRKTAKKEQVTPKSPKKRFPSGARKALQSSGLAKQKRTMQAPKKKPSRAAKLLLAGTLAAGLTAASRGAEARAPEPVDLVALPSYTIAPPLGEASGTKSIIGLLSSLKHETDRYRKSATLNVFEVPLQGGKLRLRVNEMDRSILFTVSQLGAERRSFKLSFSELNIITPEVRIQDQGETMVLRLMDSKNGRHARITLFKSDISPENMLIKVFDESADLHAARQAFQSLNTLPVPIVDPKKTESRLFMEALEAAENFLISQTQDLEFSSSSAGDTRTAFERTVDTFISLYSSVGGEAVDKLSAEMKEMGREERGRVVAFALPRLTAIMMRPFAAWQGSLGKLDRLLSSSDFNTEALRAFAWHNNLHQEYNFLLKSLREHLST
ncbi:MAG: hypothetical protein GY852_06900 [bacterium]|nr:hypothetical protein [bacterium]